jgi:ABC-type taurine transport system substrate-binding protein
MTPSQTVATRLRHIADGTCPHCGQPIAEGEGLSVAEIARSSGVKPHVVARLLKGRTIMTSNLDALARWLDGGATDE